MTPKILVLILELEEIKSQYDSLVDSMEGNTDNMDYEATEDYGVYCGKQEAFELVIEKLKKL